MLDGRSRECWMGEAEKHFTQVLMNVNIVIKKNTPWAQVALSRSPASHFPKTLSLSETSLEVFCKNEPWRRVLLKGRRAWRAEKGKPFLEGYISFH